jgi:outer membrane protein assembly factor BamB
MIERLEEGGALRAWIVAAAVALACAAPCTAAPNAVDAWPVGAPAGSVHRGPGGGAVVISSSVLDPFEYSVSAYRLDARRRWLNRRRAGCGNCDEGPQPARRQADDTYGLIGVTGDDFWSVSQAGRTVAGCTGAVLPDGTCIAAQFPGDRPTLVARRGAATLWSLAEPDLVWSPEFDVAPYVVRDSSGTAYAAYAPETDQGRLVAADAATGGLRARTPGSFVLLGATKDAALALEGSVLVAVGADGVRRWSAAIGRPFILPQDVIVDRARERVYLGRRRGNRWRTTAFATGDGSVLWRSPAGQSVRPLSLAQGGLLLAATVQGGTRAVRALGLDGRLRWTFGTAGEVVGARELTGRTVVVSTDRGDGRGPLWRIDPLRR